MDIHKYNAATIFKKSMEDVTKTERSMAKSLTFGLLFGKGTQSMVEDREFGTIEEANSALQQFYSSYPKVKQLVDKQHADLHIYNGVKTYLGDILTIDKNLSNSYELAEAQRKSVNYVIQHCSTCLAAISINRFSKRLSEIGIYNLPHTFTHDASEIEFKVSELEKIVSVFKDEYLKVYSQLTVTDDLPEGLPMDIDLEICTSIGEVLHFDYDKSSREMEFTGEVDSVETLLLKLKKYNNIEVISESEPEKFEMKIIELYQKSAYHGRYLREKKTIKIKFI